MGYGASATVKRHVVRGASMIHPGGKKSPSLQRYAHVVVDFNAWFRSFHFDGSTTPRMAIHRFWDSLLSHVLSARTVTICMDDYSKNNEMRICHYQRQSEERACKLGRPGYVYDPASDGVYAEDEVPMPDESIELLCADVMPSTWPQMWNNTNAKKKMYRILTTLMREIVVRGDKTGDDTEYIVHDMDGDVWTNRQVPGGAHEEMSEIRYGEGDLKALRWSLYHNKGGDDTLLVTIDWDAAFTAMAFANPMDILIGRVWVSQFDAEAPVFRYDESSVCLTRQKAMKMFSGSIAPAFEILEMRRFIDGAIYAPMDNFDKRLVYIMAILGFKGCDYCAGLNRFGFTEKILLDMLPVSLRCVPWIESRFRRSDPHRKMLRFYPGRFLEFLRHGSPRKPRGGMPDISELNREVHNMLWIVRYILQFDSQRIPAGPPLPDYDDVNLFEGASTVEEALGDSTIEYDFVDFVETYPTVSLDFLADFPPKQAEILANLFK